MKMPVSYIPHVVYFYPISTFFTFSNGYHLSNLNQNRIEATDVGSSYSWIDGISVTTMMPNIPGSYALQIRIGYLWRFQSLRALYQLQRVWGPGIGTPAVGYKIPSSMSRWRRCRLAVAWGTFMPGLVANLEKLTQLDLPFNPSVMLSILLFKNFVWTGL